MNKNEVWSILSNISVGQLVAWVSVFIAIIATLSTGIIKAYKLIVKYEDIKIKNREQKEKIESFDVTLKKIEESLENIQKSLEEQKDVNLKQIRHTIVHTCEEAFDKGEITSSKLNSLEEMFQEYVEVFHGNGYVKTMVNRVRHEVKIVGSSDT